MKSLKLISVLLDYPQDSLWEHGSEVRAACQELPQAAQTLRLAAEGRG